MTRYRELTGVSADRHSPSVIRRGKTRTILPFNTASETAVRHALITGAAGLSAATWVSICEAPVFVDV